jgi:hypothetical protein
MADAKPVVRIGKNSPEEVAFKLLREVAAVEGYTVSAVAASSKNAPSRQYILDTYSECLQAVQGERPRKKSDS